MRSDLIWSARLRVKKLKQKENHDTKSQEWTFSERDKVYVRNFRWGPTRLAGCFEKTLGPVLRLTDDSLIQQYQNQIRKRTSEGSQAVLSKDDDLMVSTGTTDSTTVPAASGTGYLEQTVDPSQRTILSHCNPEHRLHLYVTTSETQTVKSRWYPLRSSTRFKILDTYQ